MSNLGPKPFEISASDDVERVANLVQWDYHDSRGHFAAAKEPDAMVDDLRRFYRQLRW